MRNSLFSKEQVVYWPGKYESVVHFLKKSAEDDKKSTSLFKSNMEVLAFAACVGLHENYSLEAENTQEISTDTFEREGLGALLFLIPMMADLQNFDLYNLRDGDGERVCVKIFERYAAGGLQILHESYNTVGLVSPEFFLASFLKRFEVNGSSGGATQGGGPFDDDIF